MAHTKQSIRKMLESRRRNKAAKANGTGSIPLDAIPDSRPSASGRRATRRATRKDPAILLLEAVISLLEQRR